MTGPPPLRPGLRHPLVERFAYYLARARAWGRRATAAGLLIRAVVWLAGASALLLALPPAAAVPAVPVVLVAALLPAAAPASRWVGLLAVAVIASAGTVGTAAAIEVAPVWRLLPIGALLYLCHTAAALAAQVRTDAVVPAAVLRHWAARAGVVLAVSVAVSLAVLALAARAPSWPATIHIALGVLAALGAVALLLQPTKRR